MSHIQKEALANAWVNNHKCLVYAWVSGFASTLQRRALATIDNKRVAEILADWKKVDEIRDALWDLLTLNEKDEFDVFLCDEGDRAHYLEMRILYWNAQAARFMPRGV